MLGKRLSALMTFMVVVTAPAAAEPVPAAAPKTVRVAAVQCSSELGDVAANTKKLTELVKEASANGAKIVVLPETAITGYLSQDLKTNWHVKGWPIETEFTGMDPAKFAEPVPGLSTKHFCQLAKDLGIYLTIPFLEVDFQDGRDKPRYFNTVCLANPKGELVAHYRKLTPWPHRGAVLGDCWGSRRADLRHRVRSRRPWYLLRYSHHSGEVPGKGPVGTFVSDRLGRR